MVVYLYRCAECGPWEVRLPMGQATGRRECPACNRDGRRQFTAPLLARTSPALARQFLREESSKDEPAVVGEVPAAAHRPTRKDPRWAGLPRP